MKKPVNLYLFAGFFLSVLFLVYGNHFYNGFQFDDFHGIVNNAYLTNLDNIGLFFTEASTLTTNTGNQSYRPVETLMNAIDYRIGGGLDPFYFHVTIFFWYLVLGILLYFFLIKIYRLSSSYLYNEYIALFAVAWYMLHTANAETINYIGARSDSFSTLCIVASMLFYQLSIFKKYYLYLFTMVLGIYTKETGLMFIPILFCYIFLFEEEKSLSELFYLRKWKSVINTIKKIIPALVIGVPLFLFNLLYLTPQTTDKWDTAVSKFDYFTTQFFVIMHYIGNFILPSNLSADPDLAIITPFYDKRILLGLLLITVLLVIAFRSSKTKETRPVTYGILWFFIALIPTSSFLPRFQIANDHRTFFPYIGLIISISWYLALILKKHEKAIQRRTVLKYGIPILAMVVICLYGYGAHQRNKIWSSGEMLWYDVIIKSPENGRGLMNYGLAQMEKGNYKGALYYFERAQKHKPYWSYLHINIGILKDAMGYADEAEQHFRNALKYDPANAEGYYFYGRWLYAQSRKNEAINILKTAQGLSPGHIKINKFLSDLNNEPEIAEENKINIKGLLLKTELEPTAENFLNLSLGYYRDGRYHECISACKQALAINPDFAQAYNNICGAYNQLGEWDKAIDACKSALQLSPDFTLAKNNLNWALESKNK